MSAELETIRQCFHTRKEELIKRYRAQGGGIGKDDSGNYVIVLYLTSPENQPAGPVEVEGIPIRFEVTGKIRLH